MWSYSVDLLNAGVIFKHNKNTLNIILIIIISIINRPLQMNFGSKFAKCVNVEWKAYYLDYDGLVN